MISNGPKNVWRIRQESQRIHNQVARYLPLPSFQNKLKLSQGRSKMLTADSSYIKPESGRGGDPQEMKENLASESQSRRWKTPCMKSIPSDWGIAKNLAKQILNHQSGFEKHLQSNWLGTDTRICGESRRITRESRMTQSFIKVI